MGDLLAELKMSELLGRARSMGAAQDVLDEIMDSDDPKGHLVQLLLERMATVPAATHRVSPEHSVQELVRSLTEGGADVGSVMAVMMEMCDSGQSVPETGQSSELELAAAGALTAVSSVLLEAMAAAGESDGDNGNGLPTAPIIQPCVLLLATLAANHEVHAWFSGSGAIGAAIACHYHHCAACSGGSGGGSSSSGSSSSRAALEADGRGVEPLLMSMVANLSYQPDANAESSTTCAKEMLNAGTVRGRGRGRAGCTAALHVPEIGPSALRCGCRCEPTMHVAPPTAATPHAVCLGVHRCAAGHPELARAWRRALAAGAASVASF
jgi:hypothetical protein